MVRSIRRFVLEQRWSIESLDSQLPRPHGGSDDGGVLTAPVGTSRSEPAQPRIGELQPRQLYLRPKDFRKYEYTAGCPGCIGFECGHKRNHTEECRKRIIEEMRNDFEDRDRVTRAEHQMDHLLAEKIRQGDQGQAGSGPSDVKDNTGAHNGSPEETASAAPAGDGEPEEFEQDGMEVEVRIETEEVAEYLVDKPIKSSDSRSSNIGSPRKHADKRKSDIPQPESRSR